MERAEVPQKESYGIRTKITWPLQSVIIVMGKRNVQAFNQHVRQNETAIALLLSVGMTNHEWQFSSSQFCKSTVVDELMARLIFH